jgi:hypothetical protein|tara:strand:- start:1922 stop:2425 length:504 start_codon:yes stop_codon:yes gene_type:complete
MISKTLIVSIIILIVLTVSAFARNDYLNSGINNCRASDLSLDASYAERDSNYNRHHDPEQNYSYTNPEVRYGVRWTMFLGTVCTKDFRQVQRDNAKVMQELELLKVCTKYSDKDLPLQFSTITRKCKGVEPYDWRGRQEASTTVYWNELKKQYQKENPEAVFFGMVE